MNYSHKRGGNGLHYVQNRSRPGTPAKLVNLANPQCCCYARDFKLPCRHVLVVFNAMKMMTPEKKSRTMQRFWAPQFIAKTYYEVHKDERVCLPTILSGKYQGPESDKMGSPVIKNPRGRPRKNRYSKSWSKMKPSDIQKILQKLPGAKKQSSPEMDEMVQPPPMETVPTVESPVFAPALTPPTPPPIPEPESPEPESPGVDPPASLSTLPSSKDIVKFTAIAKFFNMVPFFGHVTEVWNRKDGTKMWHVKYKDGDEEDMNEEEVMTAYSAYNGIIAMLPTYLEPVRKDYVPHSAPHSAPHYAPRNFFVPERRLTQAQSA